MRKTFNRIGERILMVIFGLYFYRYSFGIQPMINDLVVVQDTKELGKLYHVNPKIVFGVDKCYHDYMMQAHIYRKYIKYNSKLIFHDYGNSYEFVLYFKNKYDLESFKVDVE